MNETNINSWVAILIAFFAFATTVWQSFVTRKHNRLSVKPLLEIESHLATNKKIMGISINNYGLGPALIEEIEIFYNGSSIGKISEFDWVRKIGEYDIPGGTVYATLHVSDSVIKHGGVLWILKCEYENKDDSHEKFKELLKKIKLSIKYKSIYGDHFKEHRIFEVK